MTHWLVAVNVAVYIVDLLLRGQLTYLGEFSGATAVYGMQVWRWVTYAFLHRSPEHLFFNVMGLLAFGPPVEAVLRRWAYLIFYLLGGIGGLLGYLLLWRLQILHVDAGTTMVGGSACVFGLIAAAAYLVPNRVVNLIWPPMQLRYQTLAWVFVGIAFIRIAQVGANAGGEAAHLGGAAVGFVLVRNRQWFSAAGPKRTRRKFWQPGDPASNFFREDVPKD